MDLARPLVHPTPASFGTRNVHRAGCFMTGFSYAPSWTSLLVHRFQRQTPCFHMFPHSYKSYNTTYIIYLNIYIYFRLEVLLLFHVAQCSGSLKAPPNCIAQLSPGNDQGRHMLCDSVAHGFTPFGVLRHGVPDVSASNLNGLQPSAQRTAKGSACGAKPRFKAHKMVCHLQALDFF